MDQIGARRKKLLQGERFHATSNRDLTFGRRQCKRQRRLARKLKCACADRNVDVLAERTRRHFIDFTLRGNGIFEGIYSTEKKAKVVLYSHIPRFVRCLQTEQHQGKLF